LGGPFYAGWDLRRVSRSVLPPLTARPCVCISVTKCRYSGVSGRGGRRGPPLYVEPCLKCASVDSTCSLLSISLLFTKQCGRIDTLSGLRAGRRPVERTTRASCWALCPPGRAARGRGHTPAPHGRRAPLMAHEATPRGRHSVHACSCRVRHVFGQDQRAKVVIWLLEAEGRQQIRRTWRT
jgi:hypothetical protein